MKTKKKVLIVAVAMLLGTAGINSFATDTGPKPQFVCSINVAEDLEVRIEKLKEIVRALE